MTQSRTVSGCVPSPVTQRRSDPQRARTALTTSRTPGRILESLQAATKSSRIPWDMLPRARVDGQFRIVGPEQANGDHDGRSCPVAERPSRRVQTGAVTALTSKPWTHRHLPASRPVAKRQPTPRCGQSDEAGRSSAGVAAEKSDEHVRRTCIREHCRAQRRLGRCRGCRSVRAFFRVFLRGMSVARAGHWSRVHRVLVDALLNGDIRPPPSGVGCVLSLARWWRWWVAVLPGVGAFELAGELEQGAFVAEAGYEVGAGG